MLIGFMLVSPTVQGLAMELAVSLGLAWASQGWRCFSDTYERPGNLNSKFSYLPQVASLLLVAMPGAPSSLLAPSSDALCS